LEKEEAEVREWRKEDEDKVEDLLYFDESDVDWTNWIEEDEWDLTRNEE
jgi:hypothetical protein